MGDRRFGGWSGGRWLASFVKGVRLALVAVVAMGLALPAVPPPAHADWDAETAAILIIINNYRRANGLEPVTVDNRLQQAADWHARNQIVDAGCLNDPRNTTCSHTDTMGRSPSGRARSFGYLNVAAENMMFPHATAKAAFDGWKESPPHNENMLRPNWRGVGIGRFCKDEGSCYWSTKYGADLTEAFAAPTIPVPQVSWTGTWNMGERTLVLTQNGDKVTGTFQLPVPRGMTFDAGNQGKLEGTILPGTAKLIGTWTQPAGFSIEPPTAGELEFTMTQDGGSIQARMEYPSPDNPGSTRTHALAATRGANVAAPPAAPQAPAAAEVETAWVAQPGLATDIAIGADGTIWVVGTDSMVWRWNGADWNQFLGQRPGEIKRVAVAPNGDPWVVTADGAIFEGSPANGTWQARPGEAADIALGSDGTAWIAERGGFQQLQRWNGVEFERITFPAFRVAVAPDGTAWMSSAEGEITSQAPDENFSRQRPGSARDITTGQDGSVWIVGQDGAPYRWNGEGWDRRPGANLTAIAVDPAGVVWATNSRQQILRAPATAMGTRPPAEPPVGANTRERR